MENKYLTVSALNRYLKAKIDNDVHLNRIYITGELSNVKYHYTGHCYFTLKDDKSRINAVMFQTQLKKVLFKLEDGMKVLAVCRLSVYEPSGTYQLYVDQINIDGLGNLYMAYEKRRLLLEKEGLFSQMHKKMIPAFATDIAIITASSGAAIHDIVSTIQKKCPSAKLTLYPSLVQGEFASQMLVERLKEADSNNHDVIIVGRGGGSLEDLWAFNDETLARTIYAANTPIISGVGHESDVTICDFVADYRAPTPTGAAQVACFDQSLFENNLNTYKQQMIKLIKNKILARKQQINAYESLPIFKYPERIYQNAITRIVEYDNKLNSSIQNKLSIEKNILNSYSNYLKTNSHMLIYGQNQMLLYTENKLISLMQYHLKNRRQLLLSRVQHLNAYNPLNVLERGYTLTMQNNEVITKKANINQSLPIVIRFSDGDITTYMKGDELDEKNDL